MRTDRPARHRPNYRRKQSPSRTGLRLLWLFAVILIAAGNIFHFPQSEQLLVTGMALFCGLLVRHLYQRNNLAARLIGRRWPWLIGCIAVLFGTAVILPAMAKIKRDGAFAVLELEFMALGAVITIVGLGLILVAVKNHSARAA